MSCTRLKNSNKERKLIKFSGIPEQDREKNWAKIEKLVPEVEELAGQLEKLAPEFVAKTAKLLELLDQVHSILPVNEHGGIESSALSLSQACNTILRRAMKALDYKKGHHRLILANIPAANMDLHLAPNLKEHFKSAVAPYIARMKAWKPAPKETPTNLF